MINRPLSGMNEASAMATEAREHQENIRRTKDLVQPHADVPGHYPDDHRDDGRDDAGREPSATEARADHHLRQHILAVGGRCQRCAPDGGALRSSTKALTSNQ